MKEGVIQYQLEFVEEALPSSLSVTALEAARSQMLALGLVGQDPQRYGGLGFGNLSQRLALPENPAAFVVTGSQTGHLPQLRLADYALVTGCDPTQNSLQAIGQTPPSSESMTHAVIYGAMAQVQAIIHVHSVDLWQNAHALGLPCTPPAVEYGTPQMAAAVQQIVQDVASPNGILAMLGHEDGIVAWGETLAAAVKQLMQALDSHRKKHGLLDQT